jgi:hypothetical protein
MHHGLKHWDANQTLWRKHSAFASDRLGILDSAPLITTVNLQFDPTKVDDLEGGIQSFTIGKRGSTDKQPARHNAANYNS